MKLKALFTTTAAASVLMAGLAATEPVKICIATEPYPPFSSLNAEGE